MPATTLAIPAVMFCTDEFKLMKLHLFLGLITDATIAVDGTILPPINTNSEPVTTKANHTGTTGRLVNSKIGIMDKNAIILKTLARPFLSAQRPTLGLDIRVATPPTKYTKVI